jgi:hypothetical protein
MHTSIFSTAHRRGAIGAVLGSNHTKRPLPLTY